MERRERHLDALEREVDEMAMAEHKEMVRVWRQQVKGKAESKEWSESLRLEFQRAVKALKADGNRAFANGLVPMSLGLYTRAIEALAPHRPRADIIVPNEVELGQLADAVTRLARFFELREGRGRGLLPGHGRQIGLLPDLSLLELQGNQIHGIIPNLISALNSLEHMSFARNQLTGLIPTEIGNLHRLKSLSLEDNKLNGGIPTEIGKIQTLQQARLYENNFEGTMPQEVCDLTTDEDLVYLF